MIFDNRISVFMRITERFKQIRMVVKIKSFYRSIKKNNYSICLFLLICLFFSGFLFYDSLRDAKGLTQLAGGVRTCFNRVGQGYTASLLGNARYGVKFHALTEQCFGDVGILVEDVYDNILKETMKNLNTLTTEVHWFHEKLSIENTNLNHHFEKIENLAMAIVRRIDGRIKSVERIAGQLKNIVISLSVLIIFMMLWRWQSDRRLKKNNLEKEEEAFKILYNSERLKENNVYLIKEVLQLNGFKNCLKLMDNLKIAREENEKMNMKANDKRPLVNSSEYTNMSLILSNMLDSFSNYFFKHGILLDLDEIEDVWIKGSKEELEQIIFSMINYSIKKEKETSNGIKIKIKLRKKADIALLNISDIRLTPLKETEQKNKDLPIEMIICRELVKDFDGEISFEDIVENNQIKGSNIEILLKGVRVISPVHTKRVVDLKKGKKRDILKEIGSV